MKSSYQNKPFSEWKAITENLLAHHPINQEEIVQIILDAWEGIFNSKICGFQIGKDIFPNPQMLGYFIETITAAHLAKQYPKLWKHGKEKNEKDIVSLLDGDFSVEIKSSSSRKQIFGNRSYAQEQSERATKNKSGFYLTINFEKFKELDENHKPLITLIRIGFVEHSDWRAQKSEKGQQANLAPEVYKNKFITLYEIQKLYSAKIK